MTPLLIALGALLLLIILFEVWRAVVPLSGTVAVSGLQTMMGVAAYVQSAPELQQAIAEPQTVGLVLTVNGLFMAYARGRTSAPVVKT